MRLKFTVFLLGLNIIAFGLIAYLSQQTDKFDPASSGLSAQIGRELTEATRIEIRGSGLSEPRVLEREGSVWSITEPMRWKANFFAVNRILNQLQFIEEEATFSVEEIQQTGQTLADYGLEDPILQLTISDGDGSLQLSVGTLTEIGNNLYLLGPDGEQIYVVNRSFIDGLVVELDDLRTREIFDIPVFEIQELSVQIKSSAATDIGDLKVRLANTGGNWQFEAPLAAEADPTLVSNTISTLASVKVGRFLEEGTDDPRLHGLDNPMMRVTLHGNKRRTTLIIGNPDPIATGTTHFFAKLENNPAVFSVVAQPFEELIRAQEALRERNFLQFDDATLSAIHISEDGQQIRLQRIETGEWQVLKSSGNGEVRPHRADPEVLAQLIEDLQSLRAKEFALDSPTNIDLDRLGFSEPRRTVDLYFDQSETLRLELAHPSDENEKLFARTAEKAFIYEVERRPALRILPLNALHYRNRTLESLATGAKVERITLEDLSNGQRIVDLSPAENESWSSFLEAENERGSIEALLSAIRSFEVAVYLFDRFKDAYPVDSEKTLPWRYALSAEVLLPGGESREVREYRYVFTERMSGTIQVGGSERHGNMFQVPQTLIDALYELTDTMTPPPESLGETLPDPAPVEEVPEPVEAPLTD
jgi:hypothetical protein